MAVEKKNIFLTQTVETMPYTSTSRPIGTNYPKRIVATSLGSLINRAFPGFPFCSATILLLNATTLFRIILL